MKNLKRIFLLITLVAIAGKVLFSDFDISTSESNTTVIVAAK